MTNNNKPRIEINFPGKEEPLTQAEKALLFEIGFSSNMADQSQSEKMKKYWLEKMEQAYKKFFEIRYGKEN